ncbi:MAG: hypothetical protein IPI60_20850 [Saprospiraceae bacterium]|nr:hypothetical protein [Saprospiraceae bacterium]
MPEARKFRILSSIILLFGSISISAQSSGAGISMSRWPLQVNSLPYFFNIPTDSQKHTLLFSAPVLILPDNMATAFFCRMEVKAEKASKIPVLFRLGSVDHVERMEGKRKDMFIR